jgi:hypothetical protein
MKQMLLDFRAGKLAYDQLIEIAGGVLPGHGSGEEKSKNAGLRYDCNTIDLHR